MRGIADASLGGNAANTFAGQEVGAIKAKIAPYAISTQGDEKIGIVGLTTWELLTKTSPNGTRPLDDGDPDTSDLQEVAAYLQAAVDALEAQGVNKIVMVDQLDTLARNQALASLVHGVDIMVAGGGHERLGDADDVAYPFNGHDADFAGDFPIVATDAHGDTTLIVTTDTEYTYLGRLVVRVRCRGQDHPRQPRSRDQRRLCLDRGGAAAGLRHDRQRGADHRRQHHRQRGAGHHRRHRRRHQRPRTATSSATPTSISKATGCSAARRRSTSATSPPTPTVAAEAALGDGALVVSLKNGGGIRASIGSVDADGDKLPPAASAVKPAGAISQLDIENALRFDNRLMVFDTDAAGPAEHPELRGRPVLRPGAAIRRLHAGRRAAGLLRPGPAGR